MSAEQPVAQKHAPEFGTFSIVTIFSDAWHGLKVMEKKAFAAYYAGKMVT